MVTAAENLLGIGVYTPAEAAFYARVRTQTVNRWFYGNKTGGAVLIPERGNESKDISFLDFVQVLAIRAIRRVHGVSLQKIRGAVDYAKRHYKVSHPLAMRHTTFLYVRKGNRTAEEKVADAVKAEAEEDNLYDLVINLPGDDESSLVALTGKKSGNRIMKEVVELFLEDVSFDANGLAEEYCAYTWRGLDVKMNPKRHFGEPLLPSGYTAAALWEAAKNEGSLDAAAKAYGVDRKEVELACSYLDYLQGPSSA